MDQFNLPLDYELPN